MTRKPTCLKYFLTMKFCEPTDTLVKALDEVRRPWSNALALTWAFLIALTVQRDVSRMR